MEKNFNAIDVSKQLELFKKLHDKRKSDYYNVFSEDDYAGVFKNYSDIYPNSAHFIYELIQNADDAEATEIYIVLEKDCLLFKHNGSEHFNVTDIGQKPRGHINSITGYATGKEDAGLNKIGKFGIGFKSVYQYTETPIIYDDFFKFKIENRMIPVLVEKDHEFRQKGETLFYLPILKNHIMIFMKN